MATQETTTTQAPRAVAADLAFVQLAPCLSDDATLWLADLGGNRLEAAELFDVLGAAGARSSWSH